MKKILPLLLSLIALNIFCNDYLKGPYVNGELIIMLDSAIHQNCSGTPDHKYINMHINVNNGYWEKEVISSAVTYNQSYHYSELKSIKGTEDNFELEVYVFIPMDKSTNSCDGFFEANGTYRITVTRDSNNILTGSFTGISNLTTHCISSNAVSGPVLGKFYSNHYPEKIENFDSLDYAEHPRLFFRADDLPAIKARAQTSQGVEIVNKLKSLLDDPSYTIWDGAGYGFLYLLTDDLKYADSARKAVEDAFGGRKDKDDRYAWVSAGGALRAGPSIAGIAMAYDFCYNAWDQSFREDVANRISTYADNNCDEEMQNMAINYTYRPSHNHMPSIIGGAGIALAAIKDDPGIDKAKVDNYLHHIKNITRRIMYRRYGDGSYYGEHYGPNQMASNPSWIPYLRVCYEALGQDFLRPRPNAKWLALRYAHEFTRDDTRGAIHPLRNPSSYGTQEFELNTISHSGHFVQGMGLLLEEKERKSMAWGYENIIKPNANANNFNIGTYPHRAVFALLWWPFDGELNPDGIVPKIQRDNVYGYTSCRNKWEDNTDIIVTSLTQMHYYWAPISDETPEPVMVWGKDMQSTGPASFHYDKTSFYKEYNNGSVNLSTLRTIDGISTRAYNDSLTAYFVDFAKESTGVDALIAATGKAAKMGGNETSGSDKIYSTSITTANYEYFITTVHTGADPVFSVSEDTVVLNNRKFFFNGEKFVMNITDAPEVFPVAGTYAESINVSAYSSDKNSVIRYTADGSDPNSSSPIYTSPVLLENGSHTLKFRAYRENHDSSDIISRNYVINEAMYLEIPVFSVAEGTYNTHINTEISSENSEFIYYTLDGSFPDTNSIKYNGNIEIKNTTTIRAKAYKYYNDSLVSTSISKAEYVIDMPKLSPPLYNIANGYLSPQPFELVLSNPNVNGKIKYTTDGSDPTMGSYLYYTPLTIYDTTKIKAAVFPDSDSFTRSDIAEAEYYVQDTNIFRLESVHDAYVEKNNPDANKGTTGDIRIHRTESGNEYLSLIKFNIEELSGKNISEVKLNVLGRSKADRIYWSDITLHPTYSNWEESSVTWNTKPTILSQVFDSLSIQGVGANSYLKENFYFDIDPAYLQNAINNDSSEISFALKTSTTTDLETFFSAKEWKQAPALIVHDEKIKLTSPEFLSDGNFIEIYSSDANVNIYYTTDGTTPTRNSSYYWGPISNEPGNYRAIAVKEGDFEDSDVAVFNYTQIEEKQKFEINELLVYPNPAINSNINIAINNNYEGLVMLKLTDINGKILSESNFFKTNYKSEHKITTSLPNGFYILCIKLDNKMIFEKLVIKNQNY